MGQSQTNHEYVRDSATKKFDQDRFRLSKVNKALRGPQDPFDMNFSYIPWIPGKYDPVPPVLQYHNPRLHRVDREYSNKPPFMRLYDRRLYRRQPNLFTHDANFSTCTYTPPDPSLSTIDPERQPIDMDTLYKFRNPYRATENPYGELTHPLNIPRQIHPNPDPCKVHYLDEKGAFRPKKNNL